MGARIRRNNGDLSNLNAIISDNGIWSKFGKIRFGVPPFLQGKVCGSKNYLIKIRAGDANTF